MYLNVSRMVNIQIPTIIDCFWTYGKETARKLVILDQANQACFSETDFIDRVAKDLRLATPGW